MASTNCLNLEPNQNAHNKRDAKITRVREFVHSGGSKQFAKRKVEEETKKLIALYSFVPIQEL